ncbi:MAG: SsrA-binding protein [Patescibacteria group bacterium]|nr:SsrA-binding protein [Patescibacteria group bacterium]
MKLILNKKLGLTHSVLETFEAGIELFGHEVKSLREKLGSLDGAKVIIRGGEVFLVGSYIPAYQPKNTDKNYDSHRTRRLLLSKSEIMALSKKEESSNLTMHPVSCYTKKNLIKCEVALCKKLQKHDKRESIKKEIARREERA